MGRIKSTKSSIVLIFNSFPLQDSNISSFIDWNLNFDKKDLFILFLFIDIKIQIGY